VFSLSSSEFQTVTAGKFKRTLTPTKKPTKEDYEKTKKDVEDILVLFKEFVHENRPALDIDKVATGETWFGKDALERGLCDEIKTADACLTEFVDGGYNVYEIKYSEPKSSQLSELLGTNSAIQETGNGFIGSAVRWFINVVKNEIKSELSEYSKTPIGKRYLLQDDTADRVLFED
jgi:ClpP class serine protease